MLLRHGRPTHALALEPRVLNEGGGVAHLGALEGAAGAGHLQRLRGAAAGSKLLHPGFDGRAVPLAELKFRGKYHRAPLLEGAGAVGKALLVALGLPDCAVGQQCPGLHRYVLELAAVGAGVHIEAAAHRAGDPVGKLQPCEPLLPGKGGKAREEYAALGCNAPRGSQRKAAHLPGAEHQTGKPLVRRQDIASRSQHQRPVPFGQAEAVDCLQLRGALGKGHGRRAADTEGGMGGHGLRRIELQVGKCRRKGIQGQILHHQRLRVYSSYYHTTLPLKKKLLSAAGSHGGKQFRMPV